ncbi:YebC/PmpR family DNA-binding transcriptional regulator [Pseudalkalibacillus hwajinpoensis]|uniref:YebC/PmpR family DNA-binding transcriptional regulator n=1 Tax=Guptibacillus hwajinpoensis TaxID=208199 RepID=UPI001CD3E581|nr:YebC/PmpR family DNA-binding transcriptional regulator [Pseudalkalibacillus hwajinpoensis]MCA0992571.1 YebC/PmpR family DNA-binding transcriptional regulator [Pseudalkalibacillus hwajinpoensis]
MAGHSKWKNIQRRKNAQDAKRGKVFMKLAKEIFVAAKQGGSDPETNPSLRLAIDKAKSSNMPNDNIDRAIKKATGDLNGVQYENVIYEGYGSGGAALMVQLLTDNKNRAAADVRHAFSKNNGNMGENGCVSFLFNRKGLLIIDRSEGEVDGEELLLQVIEAGAEEMETTEEAYEIYTDPQEFQQVKHQLEADGLTFSSAEVTMIPETYAPLEDEDGMNMVKLIEQLEDNDDVQEVYHNAEINDEVYEQL